jgi:hypothetical protein
VFFQFSFCCIPSLSGKRIALIGMLTERRHFPHCQGDSGAGYLRPDGLFEPRASGLPSGAQLWQDWNRYWYERFDVQFSGFNIGASKDKSYGLYSNFSSFGASGSDQRLVDGMPVLPAPRELDVDLRGTQNISMEAAKIASYAAEKLRNGQGKTPWFRSFRVIIQPASVFAELARLSQVRTSPLSLFCFASLSRACLGKSSSFFTRD